MTNSETSSSASINALITKVVVATGVAAVLAVLISFISNGKSAAVGAVVAGIVVIVFFTVGQVVLSGVIRKNPAMAMTVAMFMYLVKIGVLFALLLAFKNTTLFDTKAFAATVLLCTLVWTATEVWVFSTSKILYVDPTQTPENVPSVTDSD